MRKRITTLPALLLTLLVAAACGGGVQSDEVEPMGEPIAVTVENDLTTAATVTVYAQSVETRNRELLGTVSPRETGVFSWQPTSLRTGDFVLTGETATGELTSTPFTLADAGSVEWTLSINDINIGR